MESRMDIDVFTELVDNLIPEKCCICGELKECKKNKKNKRRIISINNGVDVILHHICHKKSCFNNFLNCIEEKKAVCRQCDGPIKNTVDTVFSDMLTKKFLLVSIYCSSKCHYLLNKSTKSKYGTKCSACNKTLNRKEFKRCGRCKCEYYCDQQCQEKDWPNHKAYCKPLGEKLKEKKTNVDEID